ncbi:hypothetical protein [Carnobacterium pleistocenium]|uniref:hypothetical protein n=1 Tax=Carnobacterium pleistocenium TaxID=181073 RepID=UPI00055445C8|nr:hypothetical protein [Carnobacterium pleistocenium]
MSREELQIQLKQLLQGDTNAITIEKKDFMIFREIWINHEEKESIIGEALHNGNVIYRYSSNLKSGREILGK